MYSVSSGIRKGMPEKWIGWRPKTTRLPCRFVPKPTVFVASENKLVELPAMGRREATR